LKVGYIFGISFIWLAERMRYLKYWLAGGACVAGIAAVLGAGEVLSAPARTVLGAAPPDLHAATVRIGTVAGWMILGRPGAGAVLLLHGVRANRGEMVSRARFLARAGYTVLLIDLPAHGESGGERITFGAREKDGVKAALTWLRAQAPGERIGAIGVSLGAAALVLAHPAPALDAVVLESMYPTIDEAVANRLRVRLGALGAWSTPLLVQQLPWRVQVAPMALRPIVDIAVMTSPVFIVSGTADTQTPPAETRRIFAAARSPKALWLVDGAAHVNLYNYAGLDYERRVGGFLADHLRQP
jgi:alpha-beta hydrolase superfamily lysophospholipase